MVGVGRDLCAVVFLSCLISLQLPEDVRLAPAEAHRALMCLKFHPQAGDGYSGHLDN